MGQVAWGRWRGSGAVLTLLKPCAPQVLTLLEKERLYLESCAVWNVEQTKIISDEDYETLKEDLEYEGSEVILMTREEIKYLVASMRYNQGKPIMEDAEYNALQTKLRKQGSLAVKHESASCKILDDGKKAVSPVCISVCACVYTHTAPGP